MTRRRTIGDNPLDSISAPARTSRGAGARSEDGPARKSRTETKEGKPPASVAAEAGASDRDAAAASPAWRMALPRRRRIRLVGGDVLPGSTRLSAPQPGEPRSFRLPSGEVVNLKRDVVRIRVEAEEADRKMGALLGWATAGAFVAGPLGALAGSLYGGRERRSTTLDIQLHDGRHVHAVTDPETAQEMQTEVG